MLTIEPGRSYEIDYTNYRGERGSRRIRALRVDFGSNEYHPTPEVIIVAIDLERGVERTFAASGLHGVRAADEGAAVAVA